MPDTNLLFNWSDEPRLVSFLLAEGGSLIPDSNYTSDRLEVIQSLDDFLAARTASGRFAPISDRCGERMFFITGPWPQDEPLYLRPIKKRGQLSFYVSQREGMPVLTLLFPVPEIVDGKERLAGGLFGHWPRYWSKVHSMEIPAPPEMKEFYKRARSFIVKISKPYRILGSSFRMGHSACKELAADRAFVFDYSKKAAPNAFSD